MTNPQEIARDDKAEVVKYHHAKEQKWYLGNTDLQLQVITPRDLDGIYDHEGNLTGWREIMILDEFNKRFKNDK